MSKMLLKIDDVRNVSAARIQKVKCAPFAFDCALSQCKCVSVYVFVCAVLTFCVSPSNADTLEITFNNVDLCVWMLSLLFVLLVLSYFITPTCMHEEKSGYSTTIRHRSKYHIAATRMKYSPISYFIWMKSNMWANAQISTEFRLFFSFQFRFRSTMCWWPKILLFARITTIGSKNNFCYILHTLPWYYHMLAVFIEIISLLDSLELILH